MIHFILTIYPLPALHLPPNVMLPFNHHHHPLIPHLLNLKQSPHAHHERYQDTQWDRENPPPIELWQDTVRIAENMGTTLKNAPIFVAYTVTVKDTSRFPAHNAMSSQFYPPACVFPQLDKSYTTLMEQ